MAIDRAQSISISIRYLDAGLVSCRWCQHILHSVRAPEKALWNSTQARTPFTRICHLPSWTSMILQRGDTIRELKSSFFVMVLWQVVEERMAAFQTLLDALVEMQRSSTVVQRLLNQFLLNTSNE